MSERFLETWLISSPCTEKRFNVCFGKVMIQCKKKVIVKDGRSRFMDSINSNKRCYCRFYIQLWFYVIYPTHCQVKLLWLCKSSTFINVNALMTMMVIKCLYQMIQVEAVSYFMIVSKVYIKRLSLRWRRILWYYVKKIMLVTVLILLTWEFQVVQWLIINQFNF